MSSRSFSVGGYTRTVDLQVDPFDARVRAFKDDSIEALPDTFENWPKEKIKAAVEGMQRADQKQQDKLTSADNAALFLASHPEFLDTQANGQLFNHELNVMFGECLYTMEHYEAAYESLRKTNFLALNKTEDAKRQKAAAKARAEAEKAKSVEPSEAELYSMSMEDLRRLSDTKSHEQMQRRGEEGGW